MKKRPRDNTFNIKPIFLMDIGVIAIAFFAFCLIKLLSDNMQLSGIQKGIIVLVVISVIVFIASQFMLTYVRKNIQVFLDGIQDVADGNLDVKIDASGPYEYNYVCESFNKMVDELKKSRKQQESFTDEFVHEFKTPISSINGFAKYLVDTGEGIETEERLNILNIIADESMRLSELSNNTLFLSKLEAVEIITDKQEFDLTEQIKRCSILLLPKMEKKNIELELYLPELSYSGNQGMLEQVWINLLSNAVKFTPEHGMIKVAGRKLPDGVEISIADNGIGMDEETQRHIFEKYYQHNNVGKVKGNGIGLSIVQRVVTLCEGRIDVKSKPDEGSTFTVFLPD
ncbi:MAG: HAMP domain-containing histidine kinase [Clostridiales bacterium]|nr:HAMP domain-containing histidine kinase [Clostridiales bacterium]